MTVANVHAVLDYWFADAGQSPEKADARSAVWFGSSLEADAEIKSRFEPLVEAACRSELEEWTTSAEGSLAVVILIDQFSRNVYRGSARAFAGDEIALAVARAAIDAGQHLELPFIYRSFFYLPFEHSEDLEDQDRCVALNRAQAAAAPEEWQEFMRIYAGHAEGHRDVVARFGRFPHRNAVLGREDTPAEAEYLRDAPRYGQ